MNVPPQVINLIKMYDNPVICEVCQRILYIEEEGIGPGIGLSAIMWASACCRERFPRAEKRAKPLPLD